MARFEGIPDIIYGTAFKFEDTTRLVSEALKAGFRGIDTSGSLSAYREKMVGDAIKASLSDGNIKREDLWVSLLFQNTATNSASLLTGCKRFKPSSAPLRRVKTQHYIPTMSLRIWRRE